MKGRVSELKKQAKKEQKEKTRDAKNSTSEAHGTVNNNIAVTNNHNTNVIVIENKGQEIKTNEVNTVKANK